MVEKATSFDIAYENWRRALAAEREAFSRYIASGISTITQEKQGWEALVEIRTQAAEALARA